MQPTIQIMTGSSKRLLKYYSSQYINTQFWYHFQTSMTSMTGQVISHPRGSPWRIEVRFESYVQLDICLALIAQSMEWCAPMHQRETLTIGRNLATRVGVMTIWLYTSRSSKVSQSHLRNRWILPHRGSHWPRPSQWWRSCQDILPIQQATCRGCVGQDL